jgi:hypothetical protein
MLLLGHVLLLGLKEFQAIGVLISPLIYYAFSSCVGLLDISFMSHYKLPLGIGNQAFRFCCVKIGIKIYSENIISTLITGFNYGALHPSV